jgi:hypothetical protein
MQKIAIAQQEANCLGAAAQDAPRLRIGAESQTANGLHHASPRFPADLRACIEYTGDCSHADARSASYISNCRLLWNCFHTCSSGKLPQFFFPFLGVPWEFSIIESEQNGSKIDLSQYSWRFRSPFCAPAGELRAP